MEQSGRRELDELMARFFKTMSAAGFSDLLELVLDGLSKQGLSLPDVASVVHVYSVLLQNAPEGKYICDARMMLLTLAPRFIESDTGFTIALSPALRRKAGVLARYIRPG